MSKKRMLSFEEAKNIAKSLKLRTLKEWATWVETNNHQHILPVDPRTHYKEFNCGADFLGYTQQEYRVKIAQARVENTDYVASAKKTSATWAKRRETASSVKATPPVVTKTNSDLLSTEEMIKFFIKEDVDLKVIINFLSEYSHPKDVYQIFLEHLKSKYTVKI